MKSQSLSIRKPLCIWSARKNRNDVAPPTLWCRAAGTILFATFIAASAVTTRAQYENTAYGSGALSSVTSGDDNTAVGVDALHFNSLGINNTATGADALYRNTYGGNNTGTGFGALFSNTTGNVNTGIGVKALYSNYQGSNNTAVGYEALYSNTTASNNTALGTVALEYNTTGENNTATGTGALFYNSTGVQNTATGSRALNGTFGNGGASYNTASGFESLFSVTTGGGNLADGWQALHQNTSGTYNTANGTSTLRQNTTGNNNTADGVNALYNNNGSNNVGLGFQAGQNLTTGSNNIIIGAGVLGVVGDANTTRIGKTTTKKTFISGISGKTVAGGVGVIVNSQGQLGTIQSSARFKDDIRPMDQTSEALLKLRPVTFRYKEELDPDKIPQFGLIAEQVENINPDLVVHDEDGKISTVRYEAVNAMLLNEFLKEHRKVEELKMMLAKQESRDLVQQKQINALKAGLQRVCKQNRTGQTSVTPKQ